jgi:beta-lactamase regulating signal transducer with metallopeptidase domain/protein involved in polysaccharide export with SLBB domain
MMMASLSFLSDSIGRAVLHSVWEGVALAMLFAVSAWVLRKASPQIRYVLGCVTLALMVFAPIATALLPRMTHSVAKPSEASVSVVTTPSQTPTPSASVMAPVVHVPNQESHLSVLQIAALGWCIGLVVVAIWQFTGWVSVQALVRRSQPADDSRVKQLNRLRDRIGIRFQIAIRVCGEISTPAVVGWLRPVILVPVTALTELPADYFESLLLHELAHIRRHDYLVNLLQTAVETVLFYHPAAWWVSRAVRQEREYCCDDETVRAADRKIYVQALAMMEALRTDGNQPLAVASSGGSLFRRINRLTASKARRRSDVGPVVICSLVLATVIISVCYAARPDEQDRTKPATTQPTTQSEVRLRLYDGRYVIASGVREEPVQEERPRDTVGPGDLVMLELYLTGDKSGGVRFVRGGSYVSNTGDLPHLLHLLDKPIHVQGIKTAELQAVLEKAYEDAGFGSHTVQSVDVIHPRPGQMDSFIGGVHKRQSSIHLLDAINERGGIEMLKARGTRGISVYHRRDGDWPRTPFEDAGIVIPVDKLLAGDPEANILLGPHDLVTLWPTEVPVAFPQQRPFAPAPATRSSSETPPPQPRDRSKDISGLTDEDLRPTSRLVIGPNDLVQIQIHYNNKEIVKQSRVSSAGNISLPGIRDAFSLRDMTDKEAETAILKACHNAGMDDVDSISLTTIERRTNAFAIIGYINRPGSYPIPQLTSRLLDCLKLGQGFSDTRPLRIEVYRPYPIGSVPRTLKINAADIVADDLHSNIYVKPGDEIRVLLAQ